MWSSIQLLMTLGEHWNPAKSDRKSFAADGVFSFIIQKLSEQNSIFLRKVQKALILMKTREGKSFGWITEVYKTGKTYYKRNRKMVESELQPFPTILVIAKRIKTSLGFSSSESSQSDSSHSDSEEESNTESERQQTLCKKVALLIKNQLNVFIKNLNMKLKVNHLRRMDPRSSKSLRRLVKK